jgi:hypothetical protein
MNRRLFTTVVCTPLLISCASQQVSYKEDVFPILEDRCLKCHISPDGPGYVATGLEMGSYHSLMQGTYYAPVVIAGDSRRSILNMLVEGRAGKLQRMPHNEKEGLSEEQVRIFRDWVDQGALDN